MSRVAVLVWLGVISSTSLARPKVAFPSVRAAQGVPQSTADLLGELLTSDIQKSGQYEVINGADIASILGFERQRQLGQCAGDECLAEIGNALGADLLLEASVGAIGQLRVLALKLIDVRKGTVKARQSETLNDDTALVEAGHRSVAALLGFSEAPSTSPRRLAGWWTLGGALGLAAVGTTFGVLAQNSVNDYRNAPNNAALSGIALGQAHAADIFFGGAVIAAGVGFFLVMTGQPSGPAISPIGTQR